MATNTTGSTATEISRLGNIGDGSHAARVEAQLDRCRGKAAEIIALKDSSSKKLAAAADPAIERIGDAVEEIEATRATVSRAQMAAMSRIGEFPGIDPGTIATVRAGASKAAGAEVMLSSGPKMNSAAEEAGRACAAFELAVGLADALTDTDLASALDGKISPEERASESFLVDYMKQRPMSELSRLYTLLNTSGADPERVQRFERAALQIADARFAMSVEDLLPFVGGRGRDLAPQEREAARALKKSVTDARTARSPQSVALAKELLDMVREAYRLLAQSDRSHLGAMGPEYDGAAIIRQRGPWRPLEKFWIRYGLK